MRKIMKRGFCLFLVAVLLAGLYNRQRRHRDRIRLTARDSVR